MWIDTHAHLQLGVAEGALARAHQAGVEKVICVGTDLETSQAAVQIARDSEYDVYSTIGLHPHDSSNGVEPIITLADETIAKGDESLVAIGEVGLDYFYDHSPRSIQQEVFARQIDLAKRLDLALVIHTRDAWDDTFSILKENGVPPRTVVHCFTGGRKETEICLDLGVYLSFSGVVTFPKSKEVQEAAAFCPVDRMVVETDSPFLTPVPHRGKPNEPSHVALVGTYISELKKLPLEEFSCTTSENAKSVFKLRSL